METKPSHLLARLQADFQSHAERLHELQANLSQRLEQVRVYGEAHAGPDAWQAPWARVQEILGRMQALVGEIESAIASDDTARIQTALRQREAFEAEDAALVREVAAIRDAGASATADPARQAEWNALAAEVGGVLDAIAEGVHILELKLELHEGRTPEQVRDFVRDVVDELPEHPSPPGVDPRTYELEYLKASIEVAHEEHRSLGFPRIIKTLFTWYETPEERVQRNLGFAVD